jgi:hypothetical protein
MRMMVGVALAAVAVVCAWPATFAGASCVGPSLSIDRATVAVGETVELTGSYFGTGCNDTGGPGPVLGRPQSFISLRFVQNDTTVPMIDIDADDDYRFVVRVMIPTNAIAGPAKLTAAPPGALRTPTVDVIITAAQTPPVGIAPPTIVAGFQSGAPRPRSGSDDVAWIVAAVVVGAIGAIALVAMVAARQRKRPVAWIHPPNP